jgi:hypothetical protein
MGVGSPFLTKILIMENQKLYKVFLHKAQKHQIVDDYLGNVFRSGKIKEIK